MSSYIGAITEGLIWARENIGPSLTDAYNHASPMVMSGLQSLTEGYSTLSENPLLMTGAVNLGSIFLLNTFADSLDGDTFPMGRNLLSGAVLGAMASHYFEADPLLSFSITAGARLATGVLKGLGQAFRKKGTFSTKIGCFVKEVGKTIPNAVFLGSGASMGGQVFSVASTTINGFVGAYQATANVAETVATPFTWTAGKVAGFYNWYNDK